MSTFVDIQGFRGNGGRFIIKEISIYKHGILSTHLFEAPYSYNSLEKKYKAQALWLFYNHHGLSWNDGYIPYTRLGEIMFKELVIKNNNNIIYIKGEEKREWLKDYCYIEAINIETLDICPNLKSMKITLDYNQNNLYNINNNSLSQNNVLKIFGWLNYHQ